MLSYDRVKETINGASALAARVVALKADLDSFAAYNTAQAISFTPATKTFTAANATETFTATAHGLLNGQKARVTNAGGALPAGLSAGLDYFLVGVTANTFQLALTVGGAAVLISTDGTGTHTLRPCPDYIEEVAGTGNFTGYSFDRTQAANAIGSLATVAAAIAAGTLDNLNLIVTPQV